MQNTKPSQIQEKKEHGFGDSDFPPFSRSEKNHHLEHFLKTIDRYHWLYRNLPFIEQIYLANSITFNALKSSSDIDIFVIAQPKRLRLARLFCSLAMWIFGIKRKKSDSAQKFCLSFFVASDHQNLESLLLDDHDVYLPYRIAHLIPLYLQDNKATIYQHNPRVQNFLPNRSSKQHIFLGNTVSHGRGIFKKFLEVYFFAQRGNMREDLLQKIWSILIQKKIKKNPDLHQGVIYTSYILKFHKDKRKEYSELIFGK